VTKTNSSQDNQIVTLSTTTFDEDCEEKWECEEWSNFEDACGTRTCEDANSCETLESKPALSMECVSSSWSALSRNLFTLNAQAEVSLGKGFIKSDPLSNSVVLDSAEIVIAQAAVASFNATISSVAAGRNAVVFDANELLGRVNRDGYSIAGENFTSLYVEGGLFSLDGVHPSSRGYAIIANEMIKVMNQRFSMSIPLVDISTVPGIHRTDYTVEEIVQARKEVADAKEVLSAAQSKLCGFGEYDNH